MNKRVVAFTRAKLLLQKEGIVIDTATTGRASVCNGVPLDLGGVYVKARQNLKSPYKFEDGVLYIDGYTFEARVVTPPNWVQIPINADKVAGDVIKPEFNGVIAATLYGCELKSIGKGCKFCASLPYSGPNFSVEEFSKALDIVLKNQDVRSLTVNAGSRTSKDSGYSQIAPYIRTAKAKGINSISLELMPPRVSNLEELLLKIKNDGASSIAFNLEIWDPELRKKIMPFKGRISRNWYLECISKASNIFGNGKAYSVLLVGIEPVESTMKGIDAVLSAGGVPSPELYRRIVPNSPEWVIDLDDAVKAIISSKEKILKYVEPSCLEGCMACGGCSNLVGEQNG